MRDKRRRRTETIVRSLVSKGRTKEVVKAFIFRSERGICVTCERKEKRNTFIGKTTNISNISNKLKDILLMTFEGFVSLEQGFMTGEEFFLSSNVQIA